MSAGAGGAGVHVARAQLAAGRPLRARAAGQSMWPFVREGEELVVWPIAGGPEVGDVVLVVLGGELVLHRVVRVRRGGGVVTKGDAELGVDPPIDAGDVLGRLAPRRWDRLVACASAGSLGGLALWLGIARRAGGRAVQVARRWRPAAK